MSPQEIIALLEKFRQGKIAAEEIVRQVSRPPVENLGFANIDHHRAIRQGFPEVIFGVGKTTAQLKKIIAAQLERDRRLLGTRVEQQTFRQLHKVFPELQYNSEARCIYTGMPRAEVEFLHRVAIVSGGTSDIPVVREAQITLQMFGIEPQILSDVGVAGIHRLDAVWPKLKDCFVLIVVAGMEGALPSVVAGLSDVPVLAVPTSQGYGANLGGMTPLMAMLSSCANGISVVNIDNGFGAAFSAALLLRQMRRFAAEKTQDKK